MSKMYFREGVEEECWDLASMYDHMRIEGLKEMKVFEAEMVTDTTVFYCDFHGEVGDKAEGGCGKICEGYKPRNGISGRCVHHKNTYEQTDKFRILKLK